MLTTNTLCSERFKSWTGRWHDAVLGSKVIDYCAQCRSVDWDHIVDTDRWRLRFPAQETQHEWLAPRFGELLRQLPWLLPQLLPPLGAFSCRTAGMTESELLIAYCSTENCCTDSGSVTLQKGFCGVSLNGNNKLPNLSNSIVFWSQVADHENLNVM